MNDMKGPAPEAGGEHNAVRWLLGIVPALVAVVGLVANVASLSELSEPTLWMAIGAIPIVAILTTAIIRSTPARRALTRVAAIAVVAASGALVGFGWHMRSDPPPPRGAGPVAGSPAATSSPGAVTPAPTNSATGKPTATPTNATAPLTDRTPTPTPTRSPGNRVDSGREPDVSGAQVTIQYPRSNNRVAARDKANGVLSPAQDGVKVWALVRPATGGRFYPQGPCACDGEAWVCSEVAFGGSGDADTSYELMAVAVDDQTSAFLDAHRTDGVAEVPPQAAKSGTVIVHRG